MAEDREVMAEDRVALKFLSKCWVPFISTEHRVYYAFGNTRMHDFLRDFKVSREMEDILVLGLGDVRHVMATVAGLSRDPFSAVTSKGVRFHLNDVDQDVIARDVILLEIMNKLDPESKSDAEFLWSVWYNAFMIKKDFTRLNDLLVDLIDKYSNSSRDTERICKFGDKQSLKSVKKTWNCWLNRRLDLSSVKQSRLRFFENAGCTLACSESNIAKYGSMQLYFDRGIKESEVKAVGMEMLTADIDGFVNFSQDHIEGRKDFVNPTLMRPGCEEWRVEYSSNAAGCYLPLPSEFLKRYSTVHEACFESMRDTISLYLETWKATKITYTFWVADMFHLCHWLLPSDMTFDFIFTSNLMDHVGLLNLLVIIQPRLRNWHSVLLTESHNWNCYKTLEQFLGNELRCKPMLLPSMVGLKLSEDLDIGSTNLHGFYRTMYARHSDTELIYWTKSIDQENVRIDLEGSPDVKQMLILIVVSTFWSNLTIKATSSLRQTPLAVMYCFQRLQHLIKGGMAALLEFVETLMNDPIMDISCNRVTWNIVCWAFGLKHQRDRLCIVEIPFEKVNAHLIAMENCQRINCRLILDYNTSSGRGYQILSLFQYDAVGRHFHVPILKSEWETLSEHAKVCLSVIGSHSETPTYSPRRLMKRKVRVKVKGKVVEEYAQPQQIVNSTTDSVENVLFCCEDTERYRIPKVFHAGETRSSFGYMCQKLITDSNNCMCAEIPEIELPYKFSCAFNSCEIKDVDANRIQAIFYKMKTYNIGRTALPFRLIADCELLPFARGQDIKNYLEETMICDLMFCSPADIESRAKALSGQELLTDDAFLVLRLVIEHLWYLGSKKDKTLNQKIRLVETQGSSAPKDILILEINGYYMYENLPIIKLRFTQLERTICRAATDSPSSYRTGGEEAEGVISVNDRGLLQFVSKMLFTNMLRMPQEAPAIQAIQAIQEVNAFSAPFTSFLPMVFPRDNGEDMISALHDYTSHTMVSSVKKYIEKIYSASIREKHVVPIKRAEIMKKCVNEISQSIAAAMGPN